jgi:tetratricopeptide (TPR) repeat protein
MNVSPARSQALLTRKIVRMLIVLPAVVVVWILLGNIDSAVADPELEEARILRDGGVLQDASRAYMRYLQRFPDDQQARWELSQIFYQMEQWTDASHQLVWLLQRNPEDLKVRGLLDECMKRIGNRIKDEENIDLILQLARFRRLAGDLEQSEDEYRQYLNSKPKDAVARHELAQMIKDQGGRDMDALLQLEQAIQYAENPMEMRYKRALWLYYDADRQQQALAALEAFTHDYPNFADAQAHLGDLYRFASKWKEAEEAYQIAYSLDPSNERAIKGYAEVLLQTRPLIRARDAANSGNYAQAADLYTQHFQEMSRVRRAYDELRNKARFEPLNQNEERKYQFYQEYVSRTPEEAKLRREYVDCLLQEGRYPDAILAMEWLIQRDPSNWQLRLERARYMTYDESKLREAEEELKRIVEGGGESAEAYAKLGDVLRYRGDFVGANKAYERAVLLDPDYQPGRDGISIIRKTFPPELSVSAAYIHDYSVGYNHFWLEGRYKHFFNVGRNRLDLAYRYLYYSQKRRHILPKYHNISKDVEGYQLIGSLLGPISDQWGYAGELSLVFYDQVDTTWQGKLLLNYRQEDYFWLQFGIRKQEAVIEHYNLNALLADVQSYDFLAESRYYFKSEDWYRRWGVHAALEAGYLSDSNSRVRLHAKLTNLAIEDDGYVFQYGIGGRVQAYEKRSVNYFSPGIYTGVGPVLSLDRRVGEKTSWGVIGAAYYLLEDSEWDFSVGGYFNRRISSSVGMGLRLDYGQTTYSTQKIRTFSGVISVMVDL